ncbi:MAG: cytochrome c [Bacteroidia bacterium]|jgi:mono/diheme cytochrome c family protein|nr:cytochrome c [Bacteroidia bacterium]
MKTKKILLTTLVTLALWSCGGGDKTSSDQSNAETPKSMVPEPEAYDPKRGEGKWTAENLNLGATLDAGMASEGEKISGVKCTSCHKMTEERLVGPGWQGVTTKRTPEWLMNFITNPDPMIDKDPEVQAMLELCLVRMPNQNLADQEARNILEYMRKIDGVK